MSPELMGIHHLKFAVQDLDRAEAFYSAVLDAKRIPDADHIDDNGHLYAIILDVPGLGTLLELRLNAAAAAQQAGFDPVTIAVSDLAQLDAWGAKLDALNVRRSPVLTGIRAWLVVFEDPDRRRIRLYTLQQHGPDVPPSAGDPWLSES